MEPPSKPNLLVRNILTRFVLFCLVIICFRFAYIVTTRGGGGQACDIGDFCFFGTASRISTVNLITTSSSATASSSVTITATSKATSSSSATSGTTTTTTTTSLWTTRAWRRSVQYYSAVFQDLIAEGLLSPGSKSLCAETVLGQEVFALREIGVFDSIGVGRRTAKPLVVAYRKEDRSSKYPFGEGEFDFVFVGGGGGADGIDGVQGKSGFGLGRLVVELGRVVRPGGVLVVHTTTRSNDTYSLNSLIGLFDDWFGVVRRVRSRIDGMGEGESVREVVMRRKRTSIGQPAAGDNGMDSVTDNYNCRGYNDDEKRALVAKAEPLIETEPMKPWLTLKRNIQNIKYLPSMVDISFKRRYVYVDVGARSYGSSIGSWFRKQYPKQNKTFEVYAVEADRSFHEEYRKFRKGGVRLLPYAAWVRNETLRFEINNHDDHPSGQGEEEEEQGNGNKKKRRRGMGRIKPATDSGVKRGSSSSSSDVDDEVQGFDFAEWLKRTVSEKDFVVMKMDVEGTEFDLIPKLVESGAMCLVDEVFLECHYNRWQRCCPGVRSAKYEKTYGECLDLMKTLRDNGVLVHQWF